MFFKSNEKFKHISAIHIFLNLVIKVCKILFIWKPISVVNNFQLFYMNPQILIRESIFQYYHKTKLLRLKILPQLNKTNILFLA